MALVKLVVGKTSVRTAGYPSEPGFVKQVNDGMRAITQDLLSCIEQFEEVTPEIMYDALEPTFDKSQRYTPYKTGDLRSSGYLEITEWRGSPQVEMGYGKGGHPDYTVYVHEMIEIPHQAPTRSKFLESAINEDMGDIADRITVAYQRFMGI